MLLFFIIYLYLFFFFFFFFSSRRRHTRWNCDWSSDVCSSDLQVLRLRRPVPARVAVLPDVRHSAPRQIARSEEHTSELQSQFHLVCRLLLEKKKNGKGRRWPHIPAPYHHQHRAVAAARRPHKQ